ncbi:MAG: FAD-dependent oxidoreductase [Cyanobacteriota bacterium]|nr:FAD-dependent oxidoreductase [Cyanobacteriota bacterium]
MTKVFDIAIIGAGLAGLTAAQMLKKAGYSTIVLEKSRGVGGRCATRRISGSRVDHGARYLETTGEKTQYLIEQLKTANLLERWTDTIYEFRNDRLQPLLAQPCYTLPNGMNSIGKFLAEGLEIWCNRRVQILTPTSDKNWHLTLEITHRTATENPQEVEAKAVVIAIPAPQALMLLESLTSQLPSNFIEQVRSVEYDACITVMAGYSEAALNSQNFPRKAVKFPEDKSLAWVGLDSSKRLNPPQPILVIQSSAQFAQEYLDVPDLQPVGEMLLKSVANLFSLGDSEWMQVHRWRYAFCRKPLTALNLSTTIPLPLVCVGDWCGGNNIEGALKSGTTAIDQI